MYVYNYIGFISTRIKCSSFAAFRPEILVVYVYKCVTDLITLSKIVMLLYREQKVWVTAKSPTFSWIVQIKKCLALY